MQSFAMYLWYIIDDHQFADTFCPADVGLKEKTTDDDRGHGFGVNQLNRVARWAQPITYLNIHECNSFTVCYAACQKGFLDLQFMNHDHSKWSSKPEIFSAFCASCSCLSCHMFCYNQKLYLVKYLGKLPLV